MVVLSEGGRRPQSFVDVNMPVPFYWRPVSGDLTSDGVQWSGLATTVGTASVVAALSLGTFEHPMGSGKIDGKRTGGVVDFALTIGIKASQATPNATAKIQARNNGGTWVDLFAYPTEYALATTEIEKAYSGYFPTVLDFNKVPFDMQMLFRSNNATALAIARLKNSSYVQADFMPST